MKVDSVICRVEDVFTTDQNRLRLPWAILLESSIEDISLGIGEHKIALPNAGEQKSSEIPSRYLVTAAGLILSLCEFSIFWFRTLVHFTLPPIGPLYVDFLTTTVRAWGIGERAWSEAVRPAYGLTKRFRRLKRLTRSDLT